MKLLSRYLIGAALGCACALSAGCANFLTPARCSSIDVAAATVEEIAATFEASGMQADKARIVADDVKAGRKVLADVCAAINTPPPVAVPGG